MSWFGKKGKPGPKISTSSLESSDDKHVIHHHHEYHNPSNVQCVFRGDAYAHNPLDWDCIPSALQAKFPHWKDQVVPSPTVHKKNAPLNPQKDAVPSFRSVKDSPENSIPYIVMDRDTLNGIALKFDTTPGKIASLNKFSLSVSAPILPGQVLYIPDESAASKAAEAAAIQDPHGENSHQPAITIPVELVRSQEEEKPTVSWPPSGIGEVSEDHVRVPARFMSSSHGCIHGYLLLNHQALIFQPSGRDPQVQEYGSETYEIFFPLEEIVYAVISPVCLHPSSCSASSEFSILGQHPSPISSSERPSSPALPRVEEEAHPSERSGSHSEPSQSEALFGSQEMLHLGLDHEETERERENEEDSSCLLQVPLDARTLMVQQSMQFLHIRLSQSALQPGSKPMVGIAIPVEGLKRSGSPPVEAIRAWMCFAVPDVRIPDIQAFLVAHHPATEQGMNIPLQGRRSSGTIEIINVGGEYNNDHDDLEVVDAHFRDPSSSWEVFSVRDIQPPRIERMEVETTLPLPNLLQPSELLSDTLIRKLVLHLISRAVGHDWTLVYSTFQHGISLQTLYRKMVVMEDSPILLIVQDAKGKLFGAMVSSPLKISERFYGTGESFLFSFDDNGEISTFFWTGNNDYIVKGSPDNVAFGSGDGHFGLWLDESLYHGSSMPCATFGNTCLASAEDFTIVGLEAWGFK